jgi:hypothetical protein
MEPKALYDKFIRADTSDEDRKQILDNLKKIALAKDLLIVDEQAHANFYLGKLYSLAWHSNESITELLSFIELDYHQAILRFEISISNLSSLKNLINIQACYEFITNCQLPESCSQLAQQVYAKLLQRIFFHKDADNNEKKLALVRLEQRQMELTQIDPSTPAWQLVTFYLLQCYLDIAERNDMALFAIKEEFDERLTTLLEAIKKQQNIDKLYIPLISQSEKYLGNFTEENHAPQAAQTSIYYSAIHYISQAFGIFAVVHGSTRAARSIARQDLQHSPANLA